MDTLQKPTSGPKDFFMHLLGFGALYASAISLIALWFNYINIKFPDPLNNYYYSYGYEQLRTPMAALIVLFPVFLFIARWISKQIAYNPERKELRIYKWLVYFTLFVSAVTVIVTFIRLIYNFLGGELTARFGLKVLVVLVVALGVFGYYIWHLRSDLATTDKKRQLLMWLTIVTVIGSIVISFFVVGSPATARKQKMDQQKVQELQNLSWQIQAEYQGTQKLPQTVPMQEYHITGPSTYQLCAVFELPATLQNATDDSWLHPAGRHCYDLDAKNISGYPKRL